MFSDFCKVVYSLIFELPFDKYHTHYKTGRYQTMTMAEKIQEYKEIEFQTSHPFLIYMIIKKKPEILSDEELEIMKKLKKRSNLNIIFLGSVIIPSYAIYLYNCAINKVFYNKFFFVSQLGALFIFYYRKNIIEKEKIDLIYSNYKDIVTIEQFYQKWQPTPTPDRI